VGEYGNASARDAFDNQLRCEEKGNAPVGDVEVAMTARRGAGGGGV
jgi:hypothetical protein